MSQTPSAATNVWRATDLEAIRVALSIPARLPAIRAINDAMAEYTITETTTLKLNVTNLTDQLYADALYRGFYTPGAPRTVQLTLKTLF